MFLSGLFHVTLAISLFHLSVVGDYPYAPGTPGTTWAGVATPAGVNPIPASRKVGSSGLPHFVAAGALAPAIIDCAAVLDNIGTQLRNIPNNANHADFAVRDMMSRPVIGIAVVDYTGVPNSALGLQAYIARSGAPDAPTPPQRGAVETFASTHAGDARLGQWNFVSGLNPNAEVLNDKLNAYADPMNPNLANPESITFGFQNNIGLRFVHKSWRRPTFGVNYATHTEMSPNVAGGCALHKLVTYLSDISGQVPAGRKIGANAQNAGVGAARLVCVAEIANTDVEVHVRSWDKTNAPYSGGQLVPSCAACQAHLPEVLEGNICRLPPIPDGMTRGNCRADGFIFAGRPCRFGCPESAGGDAPYVIQYSNAAPAGDMTCAGGTVGGPRALRCIIPDDAWQPVKSKGQRREDEKKKKFVKPPPPSKYGGSKQPKSSNRGGGSTTGSRTYKAQSRVSGSTTTTAAHGTNQQARTGLISKAGGGPIVSPRTFAPTVTVTVTGKKSISTNTRRVSPNSPPTAPTTVTTNRNPKTVTASIIQSRFVQRNRVRARVMRNRESGLGVPEEA